MSTHQASTGFFSKLFSRNKTKDKARSSIRDDLLPRITKTIVPKLDNFYRTKLKHHQQADYSDASTNPNYSSTSTNSNSTASAEYTLADSQSIPLGTVSFEQSVVPEKPVIDFGMVKSEHKSILSPIIELPSFQDESLSSLCF